MILKANLYSFIFFPKSTDQGMSLGIAIAGAILYNAAPIVLNWNPSTFTSGNVHEFMSGLRWAYLVGAMLAGTAAVTSLIAATKSKQVQPKD